MTPFDYEKNNILDYSDDSLRILKDQIEKELQRRAQEKEVRARKQVMEAIQNFLAAGYSLWVKGEVECENEDWNADYRTILGEVESVEIENDEVTLNFIEQS